TLRDKVIDSLSAGLGCCVNQQRDFPVVESLDPANQVSGFFGIGNDVIEFQVPSVLHEGSFDFSPWPRLGSERNQVHGSGWAIRLGHHDHHATLPAGDRKDHGCEKADEFSVDTRDLSEVIGRFPRWVLESEDYKAPLWR